ncbi:unnamed protein product [[Candida] boidinii]|uniref:Unnamed protein product n=1 Tax=Candida boidinii TaxID=5477 RepID=A0ACB5U637_CANBO|nr:unnamed protein product [[Candida] boidinii]GMF01082.1 unnamed protein product [[Candida] boidinii]
MIFCTKIERVDFVTFFKELKIYDADALGEKSFKEFTASELSSSYDQYMKETRPNSYENEEEVFLTAQSNNPNRGNFNGNSFQSAPKFDINGNTGGYDTKGDKNEANKKKARCQKCDFTSIIHVVKKPCYDQTHPSIQY